MQLNFLFDKKIDEYEEKNFIIHSGNKNAIEFIKNLNTEDNYGIFFIVGPSKSGKSYICSIWKNIVRAKKIDENIFDLEYSKFVDEITKIINKKQNYLFEDIDKIIELHETKILYLFNTITENKSILLSSSNKDIKNFNLNINDLKSRLLSIPSIYLNELNKISKKQIIFKLLSDRQMQIPSDVLDFISEKISNNYEAIFNFIDNLEKLIENGDIKKINITTVKKII